MKINILRLALLSVLLLSTKMFANDIPVAAVIDSRSVEADNIAKHLASKLNTSLTQAGIHSEGEEGLFLVGELLLVSEDVVETGMKKISIRKYNLSLKLEQPMLNLQFGEIAIPLEGSGTTPAKAAMDAVRKFNPSSSTVQNFLSSSLGKVDEYYTKNLDAIINKAEMLSRSGQFDEAIAMLWGCPNLSAIHTKVYTTLNKIFLAKQNHDCSSLLIQAQNAYSLKKYDEVEMYLNQIDPQSSCYGEAQTLAKKMGAEIRATEKEENLRMEKAEERAFQAAENERAREHDLEKQRVNAIKDIATAYLKNNYVTYYYLW